MKGPTLDAVTWRELVVSWFEVPGSRDANFS